MASEPGEELSEVFRLLGEQRQLFERWPYSAEQLERDRNISARIRELFNHLYAEQASPGRLVAGHMLRRQV